MAQYERWDLEFSRSVRLAEPPLGHALPVFDEKTRTLTYWYNGRPLLSIAIGGTQEVGYRHSSDGDLQSFPFVQQLYVMLDEPVTAQATFTLSAEAVAMRPARAGSEEAIIGQVGRPLVYGIAGLYDIAQDMLIEWRGCPWRWLDQRLTPNAQGDLVGRLEVELGPMPWFVNLRPHYYRTHLGYAHHKPWQWRPNPKPVAGWCSWEAYRRDVTEKNVDDVARFMARTLKPYGLEYIQIDDGYEPMPIPADPEATLAEHWLRTNGQFPGGHRGAVAKIRAHGLRPGIWISCSITNKVFGEKQPECLVRDTSGRPIEGDWIGLVLDGLPATLQKHVQPCGEGMRALGYDYLKIDSIRHLMLDGLQKAVAAGLLSNDEAERRFRAFLESLRSGLGHDMYFLCSWGVLSQVVGVADACRISMDANPTWPGLRMQMVESARWFHAQRILFTIDPDHVCVRARPEWIRSALSLVSLSGGLFMLSDALDQYDRNRIEILRRCLPPLATVAGETGPLDADYPAFTWTKLHGFAVPRETPVKAQDMELADAMHLAGRYPTMYDAHPFSSLWAFHLQAPGRSWCVVGRFATVPLRASKVPLDRLGLDPGGRYHVFDFWKRKYLGIVTGTVRCRKLPLGHCQVLALVPAEDRPQLVASSRHVSMDAVSVLAQHWKGSELSLDLAGVPGIEETYWFHMPEGYALVSVGGDSLTATARQDGSLLEIKVRFDADRGVLRLQSGVSVSHPPGPSPASSPAF